VPKQVDHEQRRREVAAVAADLVAAHGRRALTVRNVADAAGYSTTVVSHYFDDLADLLHETYRLAVARARRRVEAVLADDPGDLRGLIEAVLPMDAEREADWRIWLSFWSEALSSPAFANEQRARTRSTTERLASCLRHLVDQGRIDAGIDVDRTADRLSAIIPGIASEAIFDPRKWSSALQRRVVDDELAALGVRGSGSRRFPGSCDR
jgi:AcrR family transcriptional regulator